MKKQQNVFPVYIFRGQRKSSFNPDGRLGESYISPSKSKKKFLLIQKQPILAASSSSFDNNGN